MINAIIDKFIEGKDPAMQSDCIEEFFDESDPTWVELGFVPFEGSDQESQKLIDYALSNLEFPEHICEMLISWRDEGF